MIILPFCQQKTPEAKTNPERRWLFSTLLRRLQFSVNHPAISYSFSKSKKPVPRRLRAQ
jgi:hypothetical protein